MMSPGIRSGVNWMRPNSSPRQRAKHCASKVLAVPGGPSSRTWPPANKRGQHQVDRVGLADNGLADLDANAVAQTLDVANIHW